MRLYINALKFIGHFGDDLFRQTARKHIITEQ